MIQQWPVLWFAASAIGVLGFGATLAGLALIAYAAISHLGRPDKKVSWRWGAGIVRIAIHLFVGGIALQAVSFASRLALGGS